MSPRSVLLLTTLLATLLSSPPFAPFPANGAALAANPETAMKNDTPQDPDKPELRSLNWRVEYGEDLPPGVNKGAWRSLWVTVSGDRLSIHLGRGWGAPSLTWYGAPDRAELDKLKALADRLVREHGKPWPGGMDRDALDKLGERKKKRLCVWTMEAGYNGPGDRNTAREIRFQGADKGDNPERLAFETPFAAHVEALVRRLHETAPKTPEFLLYSASGADGALYSLKADDTGRVRVSRRKQGRNEEESEVDPAVLARVADIVRGHKIDARHGFVPPGWTSGGPGTAECSLRYDTGQTVWVRALRGGADAAARPPGFAAFERELLAALDTALDGPPGAAKAPVRQGLKRLEFSESGMRHSLAYRVAPRREAGRDVFRLSRREANRVAECVLTDEERAALEALLVKHRTAAWHGFKGRAKGVLDGVQFRFVLDYTDGREVRADGHENFPPGYRETVGDLRGLLDGSLERSGAETGETRR